ncbi:MAG: phosphotransferase [Pirellulales bacterium]|nr:phosphotransferase [Pirellulales bacterium]
MTWIRDHWQQLWFNRLNFDQKYIVDQVLSEKPRSRVLLTRRRGGKRQTIMKLSDPAAANPLEVQCLRSLQHPGIAGYLGHGLTRDRRRWMELEYIDGEPLSAWLDEQSAEKKHPGGNRPVGNGASGIFLQLLSVVEYLHCRGWLHGDLSPQNILILPGQRGVALIDFEHTRAIDAAPKTTMPRRHSLPFASPHEIAGGATTELCEQYALGKLGMALLGPWRSESSAEMEALLTRATSERPEDRYPDLHRFEMDVRAHCRHAVGSTQ